MADLTHLRGVDDDMLRPMTLAMPVSARIGRCCAAFASRLSLDARCRPRPPRCRSAPGTGARIYVLDGNDICSWEREIVDDAGPISNPEMDDHSGRAQCEDLGNRAAVAIGCRPAHTLVRQYA